MLRKPVVPFLFALALLTSAAFFVRAPIASASTDGSTNAAAVKPPSIVMQAFRQSQVIGDGPNRAALVVRYGDGGVQTRCVAFSENDISGTDLLELSGLAPTVDDSGAVCAIQGQGCGADDCFCECPFPECKYWAYYHWGGSDWLYSDQGPALSRVMNGDLEGWSWGEGDFSQGTPPPLYTFEQICPTESATGSAPQVSFLATQTTITQGECAALNWQTVNATTVLLDGAPVVPTGNQQVCPAGTTTWTLVAGNAAGQTSRTVTITVNPSGSNATPTWTPSVTPTTGAGGAATLTVAPTETQVNVIRSGMTTPAAYATPFPQAIVTQAPGGISQPGQVTGMNTPGIGVSPLATPAFVGGVPLAPTAEPAMQESMPPAPQGPPPTATRFAFARPPTETPRPRRILGDGRPTPTPILVARAGAAPGSGATAGQVSSSAAAASGADQPMSASSRAFSADLLPQYAGYFATLTALLALGWVAHRRRNGSSLAPASQPVEHPRDERRAARDERAAQ